MPGGGDEHALGHEHQHVGHEDGEAAAAGEQLRHRVRGRHHAGAGGAPAGPGQTLETASRLPCAQSQRGVRYVISGQVPAPCCGPALI